MRTLLSFMVLSTLSAVLIAGCATDVDSDDGVVDEADLSAAGEALIGAYTDDAGSFRGLILTNSEVGQANRFIADLRLQCNVAPCPEERVTGTFTAGKKTITFKVTTASASAKSLLGRFNYTARAGKLSLSRTNFTQSLQKASSYCAETSDCYVQNLYQPNLFHPLCVGAYACSAQRACKWTCGAQNADADACYSSDSCGSGKHCSIDDGVCNTPPLEGVNGGVAAVCTGTCVANR